MKVAHGGYLGCGSTSVVSRGFAVTGSAGENACCGVTVLYSISPSLYSYVLRRFFSPVPPLSIIVFSHPPCFFSRNLSKDPVYAPCDRPILRLLPRVETRLSSYEGMFFNSLLNHLLLSYLRFSCSLYSSPSLAIFLLQRCSIILPMVQRFNSSDWPITLTLPSILRVLIFFRDFLQYRSWNLYSNRLRPLTICPPT